MECEEDKGRQERCWGMMRDEWQGIHFDLPADDFSIELTRSLQSNLALTPLFTLTHPQDKMSLSGCVSQICAHRI